MVERVSGARRGGARRMGAVWCGWGSWVGPGRGRVQICHKGAPGRDRPREEARNINDSLSAFRLDPGLCGRFGQPAPPRIPRGGRSRAPGRAPQVGRRPRRAPRSAGRARGSVRRERVLAARPAAPGPRGRSWSSRTAAPIPPRNISGDPARRAQYWRGLGPCCTFDWNPLSENPRNHAETPRRSTLLKCSHVQSGPFCTWESITVTSPIHENRGIARKTRNQAVGAPLSNVQHSPKRPERCPHRPGTRAAA